MFHVSIRLVASYSEETRNACICERHDGRMRSVKFSRRVEQADPHANPHPLSGAKEKSTEKAGDDLRRWKSKNPFGQLDPGGLMGFGCVGGDEVRKWREGKEREDIFFRTHPCCLPGGNFSDWEGTEEGMKKNEALSKKKKDFPHSIGAAFPWQPLS